MSRAEDIGPEGGKRRGLTIPRAAMALFAGSLFGAVSVPLFHVLFVLVVAPREFVRQWRLSDLSSNLSFLLLEFGVAWYFFAVGLLLVGVPGWWFLHRVGKRSQFAAVAYIATFVVTLLLGTVPWMLLNSMSSFGDRGGYTIENGRLTAYGWISAVGGAAITALLGTAVAIVIWRIAYRKWN